MTSSAPTIIVRARCGDVLGELGDPRLEKMEWCEVPEGKFLMGCTEDELELILEEMKEFYQTQPWEYSWDDVRKWRQESCPRHQVFLQKFYIGKFSITNHHFFAFWKEGGYQENKWWSVRGLAWLNRSLEEEERMNLDKWQRRNGRTEPAFWNDPNLRISNRPLVGVTWFEAMAYCGWLNEQLNFTGRPYGVLDMAGNSKDWCNSLFAPYPYNFRDGRENVDIDGKRAVRGGLPYMGRYSARCTHRRHHPPDFHQNGVGFRVVIGPKLD